MQRPLLTKVAVIALPQVAPFELGVCEVFGIDRDREGVPAFDFALCASTRASRADQVRRLDHAPHGLDRLTEADLVAVPAHRTTRATPTRLLDALRAAADARGASVLSVCTRRLRPRRGRPARRPRLHHALDARRRAGARVTRGAGSTRTSSSSTTATSITSAGTAAGIDACLHLVRRELGAAVANRDRPPDGRAAAARRRPARSTSSTPIPHVRRRQPRAAADWMRGEPRRGAARAPTWPRRAEMSDAHLRPPVRRRDRHHAAQWLTAQRVLRARELLEDTDLGVDDGRGALPASAPPPLLRHHFARRSAPRPQLRRHSKAAGQASMTTGMIIGRRRMLAADPAADRAAHDLLRAA